MPLVEALVGSHPHTLYDAIFDIELSDEQEQALYEDFSDGEDEDAPALRSLASRENVRRRPGTRTPSRRRMQSASHPSTPDRLPSPLPPRSPLRRPKESLQSDNGQAGGLMPGLPVIKTRSPLARLFAGPRLVTSVSESTVSPTSPMTEETLAGVRKLENVLEGIRDLPVHRLKDEMKELQERQARIENLLLTLTRGMRNETSSHTASRHNSTF